MPRWSLPRGAAREGLLFCACVLLLVPVSGSANAQQCRTGPRVPFAGDALPLSGQATPSSVGLTRVYPNVALDQPLSSVVAARRHGSAVRGREDRPDPDPAGRSDGRERDVVPRPVGVDRDDDASRVCSDSRSIPATRRIAASTSTTSHPALTARAACPAPSSRATRARVESEPGGSELASSSCWRSRARQRPQRRHARVRTRRHAVRLGGRRRSRLRTCRALTGKLLRIDVRGSSYAIPADNPFRGQAGRRGEIWAYGLRNPWRFSFDRLTGDLWIGDVGQIDWEEVDFVPAGNPGGVNFGWPYCEGTHDGIAGTCSSIPSRPPLLEYSHDASGGLSVTGGYVYRGDRLPSLYGAYLYADFGAPRSSGRARRRRGPRVEIANPRRWSSPSARATDGEFYLVAICGRAVPARGDHGRRAGSLSRPRCRTRGCSANVSHAHSRAGARRVRRELAALVRRRA